MILFLNEWSKPHRYADRFDSFNKFLNKLLEKKQYQYVDLVELGIEYSNEKPEKWIDGKELRFYAVEQLLKETLPSIIQTGSIPILEVKVLWDVFDEFSDEKYFYLTMLLNSFSQVAVYCGSKYDFEHFSKNPLVFGNQILYDAETSFFTDVESQIEEKLNENSLEKTISSVDGFGFYLSTANVDADRPAKLEFLPGSTGNQISFEEFLQWLDGHYDEIRDSIRGHLLEERKDQLPGISNVLDYLSEHSFGFVRKHHPIELFLKQ